MDWTPVKSYLGIIATGILAALSSVSGVLTVIGLMFIADLVFGIIAGWVVNNEGFRWKKSLLALLVVTIYGSIVAMAALIGTLMNDRSASEYAIKVITYVFIYITGTNTLKNLCRVFPNAKLFTALYWLLSLEFTKRFPNLAKAIDKRPEEEQK